MATLDDQLALTKELLNTLRRELGVAEKDIGVSKARSAAFRSLLDQGPQFLVLAKAVGDDALFDLLGIDPAAPDLERVKELLLLTQEVNPVYTTLAIQLANERAEVDTAEAKIILFSEQVAATEAQVKALEKEQLEKAVVQLSRLDDQLAISSQLYQKELQHFVNLSTRVVDLRTAAKAKLTVLSEQVATTEAQVKALEKEQLEKAGVQLSRLDDQLAISSQLYQNELQHFVNLSTQAVDLRTTVEQLEVAENVYRDLVKTYKQRTDETLARVGQNRLDLKQFDRQTAIHSETLDDLSGRLQEASIAKEEQLSSIRIVEKAIIPTASIGPRRSQSLLLGTALGLVLGALAAFGYHFLRIPATTGKPRAPRTRGGG